MSSIYLPVRIEYGLNVSKDVGKEFKALKCSKVLIVTDSGIVNSGLLSKIIEGLESSSISFEIFEEVIPDPNVDCVEKASNAYKRNDCDGLLAVGGGSSIDTAKGAGIMITNEEPIMELAGINNINNPIPPLIAIPTTCGTGAEVTDATVITNQDHFKVPFVSKYLVPKVAFLDSSLLSSLPSKLVAATGMDALTHAIESLTNKNDNWFANSCAIQAIRKIVNSIKPAVNNGDPFALSEMLYGSTLAGIAFSLNRLGLVHAMSHPVSGLAGVPHGVANAVLLPYVMGFNIIGDTDIHAVVSKEMGVPIMETPFKTAQLGVEEIIKINEQIGIPKSFRELNVDQKLIPKMIEDTFKSGNIDINARKVTSSNVEQIYKLSFLGN